MPNKSVMRKSAILYKFKGFNFDIFKSLYLHEILPREEREFIPYVPMADFFFRCGNLTEEEYMVQKAEEEKLSKGTLVRYEGKTGVKDETKILNKVLYLMDAIIRRANAKKDIRAFSLSSQLLKSVIGNEYKQMLIAFTKMKYIELGDGKHGAEIEKYYYYHPSRYSMIYSVSDSVEVEAYTSLNKTILKYKEKTASLIQAHQQNNVNSFIDKRHGEDFRKTYLLSLNYVKIADKTGFETYIKDSISKNPKSHIYYHYIESELSNNNKVIQKIDDSGRMYHVLTNLERELKSYLNILISLDSKNSHPLLFNYFIFHFHNISILNSYLISSLLSYYILSNNSFHNVGKNLRNHLIDNGVIKEEIAKLSDNELEYIYLTSTGRLWDDIANRHPELDRNEVKVEMFKQVFYSNTPYAFHWKEYAVEFKKQFPDVYRLIGRWKKRKMESDIEQYMESQNLSTEKPTSALSLAMMNLESKIFTEILRRIYKKRWRAVHIHDCIIVPDTGKKNQPNREDIEKIMREVYKEFGLFPTFD